MDVSIVVMAHEQRREWAEELSELLDAPIVWDAISNVWDTGRRALLEGVDMGADWHCVIQDDALPHPDLPYLLDQLVAFCDDEPIGLYLGARRHATFHRAVHLAREKGAGFVVGEGPIWGPGIVQPTHRLQDVVDRCDGMRAPAYDRRIMDYWRLNRTQCAYTVPSLVDHRGIDENPSIIAPKGRTANRKALDADWSRLGDWSIRQSSGHADVYPIVWLVNQGSRRRAREGSSAYLRMIERGWKQETPHR